ncbi:MAG: quinone-dependent dihydroorotate dehydrogenase [Burkholderiaceae bacterium]
MSQSSAIWSAYSAVRPLLFSLDPERAHHLAMAVLSAAHRGAGVLLPPSAPLEGGARTVAGLVFPNPIGLAAGLDKDAVYLDALGRMGFGFLEVGTVTPRPQPGNPRPRMFRLPAAQALINRLGFNNLGLEAFLRNVSRSQWVKNRRGVLGLNIGKNADTPIDRAIDDYQTGLEAVYPWADYVTINISSPNTKNLRDLQSEQALAGLLTALKRTQGRLQAVHQKRVPLFLKIAPDLTESQLESIAQLVRSHEIEGLIATNTTLDRTAVESLPGAQETGGLSGGPLSEKSTRVLAQMRQLLGPDTALIGVGGILSAQDGLEKARAGADLVQVYTGLIYRGPALVADLVNAFRACQSA